MGDPNDQRWSELRDELKALRVRLEALEREIASRSPSPARRGPPPGARRPVIETRLGLTLLNRIGVITLILGAAFFFAYVAENQWIGPWQRIAAGVVAAGASLLSAEYLLRNGQRPFAQGMAGLGIALLFVSWYAGYGFYRLYPAGVALLLMVVPSAISLRYDSLAVAMLGLFGGFAAPVLIETTPLAKFGFVLLLDGVANRIAARRGWWGIEALAMAGTTYLFVMTARDTTPATATLFLAAYYALFTISPTRSFICNLSHTLGAAGVALVWRDQPVPFLLLSLALAGAGIRLAPAGLIGFWLGWGMWQTSYQPLGQSFAAATLVFAAYFSIPYLRAVPHLVTAVNGPIYFIAMFLLLDAQYHAWMAPLAVALAAVHWFSGHQGRVPGLNYSLAAAFALVAIAAQFTGFLVTIGWAVEAAALAYIGQRIPAVAVLVLIGLRLAWFDVHEPVTVTLLNARFAAFMAAAASYWLTGARLARRAPALTIYMLGHVILLWAGGLEIAGWAVRNAPGSEVANAITAGLSILGAAYGVALIAAGVVRNGSLNRVAGLALIGLVVLKLYAYDVWLLDRLYRTTAFIALGALLVLGSYLYSRYRIRIESWLQTADQQPPET